MKNMLTPKTPVRSLIKIRPMAIEVLDKRKIRFWDSLDKPLADVIRGEIREDFLEEVSSAQIPAQDSDWNALPLYYLVDYLTQGHRDFLLQDIADIGHILDIHTIAETSEAGGLRKLHGTFQDFVKDFQIHVEEEETYLFPKILRYEACLRDHRVHPEFHKGSVQSHMVTRTSQNGKRLLEICTHMAASARFHAKEHVVSFAGQELLELLEAFQEKLEIHGELEAKVLFPVARELERNLYNLTIDGNPAMANPMRGPMDSGILRLRDR
jgi:iron-sulfur cluster repair protein YtfE (RIC family)